MTRDAPTAQGGIEAMMGAKKILKKKKKPHLFSRKRRKDVRMQSYP